ncbi:hypothetical protein M409DRAFT_70924 [Zasmidium cellare ATCC 36951]|uniref:RTA1 like protein n=1 Tax=Zasmidium cellare ATCC 36951 TaxID=1080233 RepID=A0A6A6BXS6_ZASCE|nr:uncharacterized protein M409DRAFT_70924 [Zasmidium cellare ATCC 36951]KAF2159614.1 hypothetical protein M409DRAFT_70924 [Zasmidium cellare ATCC 36951]
MGNVPTVDPPANCTIDACPVSTSFYDYRINLAANLAFLVLFSLLTFVYLAVWLAARHGHAYAVVMILGTISEIIGYAGRVWSYYDQWNETPYLIQIICLTIAPAFYSAGIYLCLAGIVRIFGEDNSRVRPLWYTYIFVPCDIIALILQAAGGALAATSIDGASDTSELNTGVDILLAGLSWQVFTLTCFLVLCADLALRIRRRCRKLGIAVALSQDPVSVGIRTTRRFQYFLGALSLATILILWRCAYRVAELNDGFSGPITYKQGLFIGFEGVLIVVAATLMVVAHPVVCMRGSFVGQSKAASEG